MRIVTDLSNSFNPVPKIGQYTKNALEETGQKKPERNNKKVQIKPKSRKLANLEKKKV